MYKVLIVDDEASICQNIRSKIERLSLPQIDEIRVCYSGEDAISLCSSYKPQIVITDIMMDNLNGIELARVLSSSLFPVKFIFLSGYDNFSYVKEAFLAGASDYLLKPLLTDQLRDVLQKTIISLNNPGNGNNQTRTNLFQTAQALPILLHIKTDPLSIQKAMKRLSCLQEPFFCCCMLRSFQSVPEQSLINACNMLYDFWDTVHIGKILCVPVSYNRISVLINTPAPDEAQIYSALTDFISQLQKQKILMCGALSKLGSFQKIPELLHEAQTNLLALLESSDSFLSNRQIDLKTVPLPQHLAYIKALFDIAAVSKSSMFEKLDNLLSCMECIELCEFYLTLAIEVEKISRNVNLTSTEALTSFPSVFSFSSRESLLLAIYDKFEEIPDFLVECTSSVTSTAELVKGYIDSHYTERLSLHTLSEQFSVSYAHLSKILREHLNMPFSEYIIYLRMNKACELLQSADLSVSEISEMVGYDNAFNFTRAFKNQYGMSPSRYRSSGSR